MMIYVQLTLFLLGVVLPAKKKVVEVEPEPPHELTSAEGGLDIDMHFSAIVSTAEYDCPTRAISFKDTYVLQTKIFKLAAQITTLFVDS